MRVITFEGYIPSPRYDGTPWTQAQVEEGSTAEGPWSIIDTIILPSPDTDPANPAERAFTTHNAVLNDGWYRVTFFDQTGNEGQPTFPVQFVQEEATPFMPTTNDVAQLLRVRTKNTQGRELGVFSQDTRPTASQVQDVIEQATRDITSKTDKDVPEGAYDNVREAITILSAMMIELSYFGEQINSNRSPYPQLKDLYSDNRGNGILKDAIAAIEREAEEEISGELPGTNRPSYSFPEADARLGFSRPL
jgi:hypothetical protein